MRHRKRGRHLGRSSSHRKALLRNLACSLLLTERDAEFEENVPKNPGRIQTTLHKAKEVRPLVEKCVTIAKKSIPHETRARELEPSAKRGTDAWNEWRHGQGWQEWAAARAPVVAARRRALQLLGNKVAVNVLFEEIAPRMVDRPGGYTRILRLATPRLGDAGTRAILEFTGMNDRAAKVAAAERPTLAVEDDEPESAPATQKADTASEGPAADEEASADDENRAE